VGGNNFFIVWSVFIAIFGLGVREEYPLVCSFSGRYVGIFYGYLLCLFVESSLLATESDDFSRIQRRHERRSGSVSTVLQLRYEPVAIESAILILFLPALGLSVMFSISEASAAS